MTTLKKNLLNTTFAEVQFTIPEFSTGNSGVRLYDMLLDLEEELASSFVGYLCSNVDCIFPFNPTDNISDQYILYTVLVQPTALDLNKILEIAIRYNKKSGQPLFYFKNTNGEVTFKRS